ncbi:MAG: transcription elongation factor GreA [Dehalococcoidia bacterium]|nr:transcription elongation factor GreA [Dehalococcoidia bacterium]
MVDKQVFVTPEGLEKLKAELEHLRTVRRQEVAEQIQKAKELGSTVNNPEYETAKNQQSFVEGRILTLEAMINRAAVIPPEEVPSGRVRLGSTVVVTAPDGKKEHYTIVGSAEANPAEGKISNESPVGRALLGKKVGDHVEVAAPAGVMKFKVAKIE